MNSSMSFGGGGFDNFNTTTSIGGGSETRAPPDEDKQTIVPLVIQQVLELGEGAMKLWCIDVNLVTIVALVRNSNISPTKVTYSFEDHTGTMEGYLWLEEGDSNAVPPVMGNTYVQVYGTVKKQQGATSIMVFKIEPVRSFNQVTTHLLEVLNARYKAEKWQKEGTNATDVTAYPGNDTQKTISADVLALTPDQKLVYRAICDCKAPEGISTKQLIEKFPQLGAAEISHITFYMCNEGHIYTSIDSDHYLSTDS